MSNGADTGGNGFKSVDASFTLLTALSFTLLLYASLGKGQYG